MQLLLGDLFMYDVIILTISPELKRSDFNVMLNLLSPEKRERIKKFHFFQDARNCLLGDVLSRVEICRVTGLNNRQLDFSVNGYGKPVLINIPHIYFNISHAGNYVACVIADKPVGIDIEVIKPIDLKLSERFFTIDEVAYIRTGEATQRFYEIWTKKESHVKWEGKGLHKPLSSFSVFDTMACHQPTYHSVINNDECICHVCAMKKEAPSIRVIDVTSLVRSASLVHYQP